MYQNNAKCQKKYVNEGVRYLNNSKFVAKSSYQLFPIQYAVVLIFIWYWKPETDFHTNRSILFKNYKNILLNIPNKSHRFFDMMMSLTQYFL